MTLPSSGRPAPKGVRLFYQIASRLVVVAALFAVLEVVIVVAMYINDEETLSEDLVSLESRRIVESMGHRGVHPDDAELLTGSIDPGLCHLRRRRKSSSGGQSRQRPAA